MATESNRQPNHAIASRYTHVLADLLTQPGPSTMFDMLTQPASTTMFDMLTQPASTTMFGSAPHASWYCGWSWPNVFVDGSDTPTTPTKQTTPTTPTKHLNQLS